MWYSYRILGKNFKIGYATSSNGINWNRRDNELKIPIKKDFNDQMSEYPAFFNHKNKFFLLFNGNNYGKTGVGLVEMKYEKKNNFSIIGAGISGLISALILKNIKKVKIFEISNKPGGIINDIPIKKNEGLLSGCQFFLGNSFWIKILPSKIKITLKNKISLLMVFVIYSIKKKNSLKIILIFLQIIILILKI